MKQESKRAYQVGMIALMIMGFILAKGNVFNIDVFIGIILAVIGGGFWIYQDEILNEQPKTNRK